MKNIKELAKKHEDTVFSGQENHTHESSFLAGSEATIKELSQVSGFEFDLEAAKKYGRDLFGGAPDTIGQSYVVQAMRHQYDKDITALAAANAKLLKSEEAHKSDWNEWAHDKALLKEANAKIAELESEKEALLLQKNNLIQREQQLEAELKEEKLEREDVRQTLVSATNLAKSLKSQLTQAQEDLSIVRKTLDGQRKLNNESFERENKLKEDLKEAEKVIEFYGDKKNWIPYSEKKCLLE